MQSPVTRIGEWHGTRKPDERKAADQCRITKAINTLRYLIRQVQSQTAAGSRLGITDINQGTMDTPTTLAATAQVEISSKMVKEVGSQLIDRLLMHTSAIFNYEIVRFVRGDMEGRTVEAIKDLSETEQFQQILEHSQERIRSELQFVSGQLETNQPLLENAKALKTDPKNGERMKAIPELLKFGSKNSLEVKSPTMAIMGYQSTGKSSLV